MVEAVEGPLQEITEQQVERALKSMKSGRVAGLSGLTSNMLKYAGHMGVVEGFSENYEKWNNANGVGIA